MAESRVIVPKMPSVRDSHEHPMGEGFAFESVMCNLCGDNIKGSWYYYCNQCGFLTHLSCGEFPLFINLSSHPQHPLKLVRLLDDVTCSYCEKISHKKAFMYKCHLCSNFYIHFSCSKIPPIPTLLCDGQNHVQYICHNHPMTLVESDGTCDGVVRHCFTCQSPLSSGPSYICKKYCPNVFHKTCAELPEKIEHSLLHPYHPLKLQVSEPQSCDACHKRGGKLMYLCCEQGCNFRLGTECAFLTPTVKWDRHDHSLFLMENAYCGIDQYCDVCHNSYEKRLVPIDDEVSRTRSFLFRCMECNFNIHFPCGPLPITIEHECHMHVLTLVDSSVGEDDSTESYCDVCEKKRDQQFRVYYCNGCKYVAHIHCVVSKVTKVLKGDHSNVKLLAVGDAPWMSNDTDMAVEGISTLTMAHIMESLSEEERNQLMHPFTVKEKAFRKRWYERYRKKNADLERKGDGEDIQRIQSLFNSHHFVGSYWNEFNHFIPDEDGLKLDERYLKMKVVDVKGYQVPHTLAPVFKTLLSKYPHFRRNSRYDFTPEMRSVLCTFLCIVFDRMSTTKVEDITKDLLLQWFYYYDSIDWISDFDITFLRDRLRKLIRVFLGLEARRFKKEMAERLQQRITDIPQQMANLQAELESSKVNLEKVKSCGESTTSDVMKETLQLSSKFKRKDAACEDLE